MLKRSILIGISWGLAALAPALASATTVRGLPEPELTRQADAVVFGRIITTRVIKAPNGFVITEADLQVYEAVKGAEARQVIKLRMPGGDDGGLRYSAPGAPTLQAGQMWVGFLNRTQEGWYTAWGLGFGLLPARTIGKDIYVGRNGYEGNVVSEPGVSVEGMLHITDTPVKVYLERLRAHLREPLDPVEGEGGLK